MAQMDFNLAYFEPPPPPFTNPPHGDLTVRFTNPSQGNNPIYPATYLQFSWSYEDDHPHATDPVCEIFAEDILTARDVVKTGEQLEGRGEVYEIVVPAKIIPRRGMLPGFSVDMRVTLHAWKGQKLLGRWEVGVCPGMGITKVME